MDRLTHLTLRQALEQFYTDHHGHLSHEEPGLSEEAIAFFKAHDITHVLFNCDTSLFGEGAVKIWTIFGTDLGFWNHIRGYKKVNAYNLAKNFTVLQEIRNFFKLLFSMPLLIIRAKRMKKPWSWRDFESYLDQPITQIREEFNIEVLV